MSTTENLGRVERLHRLVEGYPGDWTADVRDDTLAGSPVQRFALLMNRANAPGVDDWWITHHSTLADALESAGEDILFGNTAVGVFDLDSGDVHGVHVAVPVVSSVGGTDAPAAPWDTTRLPAAAPAIGHARALGILRFVEQTLHDVGAPSTDADGAALNASGMLDDWLAGRRREQWGVAVGGFADPGAELAAVRADADAAREILRAVALGWASALTDRDGEPIVSLNCVPWRLRHHSVRTVASLTLQELATALVAEADALRFTSTRFEQALKTIMDDTSAGCGCGHEAAAALRAGCARPDMYAEVKRARVHALERIDALEATVAVLLAVIAPVARDADRDEATRALHDVAAAITEQLAAQRARDDGA
jgi:hypothetical protein